MKGSSTISDRRPSIVMRMTYRGEEVLPSPIVSKGASMVEEGAPRLKIDDKRNIKQNIFFF